MDEQFVHEDQMRNARTQGVGSMVSEQNRQNALELMRKMHKIDTQNAAAKARIENNLDKALQCVDNVRDFVGSPEHILGNPKTKHGEIAENVDVWFHNADQIMHNQKADATFEGVGRTVATDYKVHGVDVQSKYINGANNSLSHVLKHMEDYKGNYEAFGCRIVRLGDSRERKKRPHLVKKLNHKSIKEGIQMKQNRIFDQNSSQKARSWHYNMDTNRAEAQFADGSAIAIDCLAIEDEYGNTPAQRAELDWLLYNKPLECVQLVLSGEIEHYLSLGCDHGKLKD